MNKEKITSITVKDFYLRAKDFLKLHPVLGRVGFAKKLGLSDSRKGRVPVKVCGKEDAPGWESLSSGQRRKLARESLLAEACCLIVSNGVASPPEMREAARERKLAIFHSSLSQRKCQERLKDFFSELSPDKIKISGGLLRIFGLGVLIVGDSGIGKSESALELICRGHRFVCDDVVSIEREPSGALAGTAPRLVRNFMEIRGLGIINIKEIFGAKAIKKNSSIDLVVRLKKFQPGKEDDRIGLKFPEDFEILGRKIPSINIPVAPGRNIALLIEVACQVHLLKKKGYYAPQDIVGKLNRVLSIRWADKNLRE